MLRVKLLTLSDDESWLLFQGLKILNITCNSEILSKSKLKKPKSTLNFKQKKNALSLSLSLKFHLKKIYVWYKK